MNEATQGMGEEVGRLVETVAELSKTALQVKRERDLCITALRTARVALLEPDVERREALASLIEATLVTMGERT